MRTLLQALAIAALIGASVTPAAIAASRPRAPFAVAVVFPPWWAAGRIEATAAGMGQIVGRGALHNIVVIYGDGRLESRARKSGALVVLDPTVPGACRDA